MLPVRFLARSPFIPVITMQSAPEMFAAVQSKQEEIQGYSCDNGHSLSNMGLSY